MKWSICRSVAGLCGAWMAVSVTGIAQQPVATREQPHMPAEMAQLLARRVTVDVDRVPLRRAIAEIAASARITVQYRYALVDQYSAPVTVHVHNMPLADVFDRVLAGTQLKIVALPGAILGIEATSSVASETQLQGEVAGHVRDSRTGAAIRGATVLLDDATHGVLSGDDGAFRLVGVSAGTHRITVRLLGYARAVTTVAVSDAVATAVDVALASSANTLDQVVVTGTIIPTELKAVPNAITVITAKQIEERGITKIDQLFRGDVPGLFAQNRGSDALLDEVTMFSRGATALNRFDVATGKDVRYSNPIKTYLDGIELANPSYLSQIDPRSIERIEILTGPQASTIYGSSAINGVMQIFTKRGTSNTPQLTLNLLSGFVQNNFSSALTPQHDYSGQMNGVEGRLSYNVGGSWNYIGAWTPAKQTTRISGFGGIRLELPTMLGRVTADLTLRHSLTQNQQRGRPSEGTAQFQEGGWYTVTAAAGVTAPTVMLLKGQTVGLTVGYAPQPWWSHEFRIGQDVGNIEQHSTAPGYTFRSDSTLQLSQTYTNRHSLQYTTTARVPLLSLLQATGTLGIDGWQNLSQTLSVLPKTLTGTLTNFQSLTRQPGHNTGGFLQTQLGVMDRLFFTYGLRAEWNPEFGSAAQPNYAPRYGAAYTQDVARTYLTNGVTG